MQIFKLPFSNSAALQMYLNRVTTCKFRTISLVYTNIFIQDYTLAKYILIKGAFLTG